MRVTGDTEQIINAIDSFPQDYHADFFEVRAISRQYLAQSQPGDITTVLLAKGLHRALINWGAGKRKAPQLRGIGDFEATFLDPVVHTALVMMAQTQIPNLEVVGMHRQINRQPTVSKTLSAFDSNLLAMLHTLADRLFVNNTNITYPMKALLLVTGLMPAFDGQVRKGLGRAGFAGMDTTRFLLPDTTQSSNGKKLTRLPFILGKCWSEFSSKLCDGVEQSKYPGLVEEPGRIFDVLLFMQAIKKRPVILTCVGDGSRWYDLR